MNWKTKQSFLILVILHWPFYTLPQAHAHNGVNAFTHTHICRVYQVYHMHYTKLTPMALYYNNTPTDRVWQRAVLQTYSCLTVCFSEPWFTCLADPPPRVIHFPAPLTFLPLNSEDYGDWDHGFDLRTTPLNHREEAGIFSKGCLCAPVPQEDWTKSSMKVSELQSKTALPRVQKQILSPVTLLLCRGRAVNEKFIRVRCSEPAANLPDA